MCIECVPPQLVDLTPRDYERFFRVVGGRRCNNLNHLYVMPADEEELRVRRRVFALRSDDDGLIDDAIFDFRDNALYALCPCHTPMPYTHCHLSASSSFTG